MVVLVCGARNFKDRDLLFSKLDELHAQMRLTEIVHGDQPGAEALAGLWARSRGCRSGDSWPTGRSTARARADS